MSLVTMQHRQLFRHCAAMESVATKRSKCISGNASRWTVCSDNSRAGAKAWDESPLQCHSLPSPQHWTEPFRPAMPPSAPHDVDTVVGWALGTHCPRNRPAASQLAGLPQYQSGPPQVLLLRKQAARCCPALPCHPVRPQQGLPRQASQSVPRRLFKNFKDWTGICNKWQGQR